MDLRSAGSVPVFRVFLSSTFTDFRAERDALQATTFPRLRDYCRQRGARFQAVDLRWGVSQEASADQQTMTLCLSELHRCQKLSPRPNFVVLLGDRYGWRPLPSAIPEAEFAEILTAVADANERSLLCWQEKQRAGKKGWYRRDDNAVPPEFCLRPWSQGTRLAVKDYAVWRRLEDRLRAAMRRAIDRLGWPDDDPRRRKYEDSATHQEIRHGALEAKGAETHVFCCLRQWGQEPSPEDDGVGEFVDLLPGDSGSARKRPQRDEDARQRLKSLKHELRQRFGPSNHVFEYTIGSYTELAPDRLSDPARNRIGELCARVEEHLRGVIDEELRARPSDRQDETVLHRRFGDERSAHFLGRRSLLRRVIQYVVGPDTCPLVVYGTSGCGKTAFLAQAARLVRRRRVSGQKPRVITRFVGATPASTDIRLLLTDLCEQIAAEYQDPRPVAADFRALVQDLHQRLAECPNEARPLCLFLDAVDQLNPTDGAHFLSWLPQVLPPHVKWVVSVLKSPSEAVGRCYRVAKARWPHSLVRLPGLSLSVGERLLDCWLASADGGSEQGRRRTLQPLQRRDVLDKFAQNRLPLYLKLAYEEARRWKSFDPFPEQGGRQAGLRPDVPGILEDLFCRLEEPRHHGPVLTACALGYLAAARQGLTEDEALDVLSADADVMADFVRRSPTERARPAEGHLARLPVQVWSRLYADLERCLAYRAADSTSVLWFYHRQVRDAASDRYLRGRRRRDLHRRLGRYFASQPYRFVADEKGGPASSTAGAGVANFRKLGELPWHAIQARRWATAERLFRSPAFLEAEVEAGRVFQLANDFQRLLDVLPPYRPWRKTLELLDEAMRRDIRFLAEHPESLFECLWNTCWWYDCRGIEKRYDPSLWLASRQMGSEPLWKLMARWRSWKERKLPIWTWRRSLSPPPVRLGTGLQAVLRGHRDAVRYVVFSPDGRRLLSGGEDGTVRVWDVKTAIETLNFKAHQGPVTQIAAFGDRQYAATGSQDGEVRVWETLGGAQIATLASHAKTISALAVSPRNLHVASGSADGGLCLAVLDDKAGSRWLQKTGAAITALAFSPDGGHFATAAERHVQLWPMDGDVSPKLLGKTYGDVRRLIFSANGERLFAVTDCGVVYLYELVSFREGGIVVSSVDATAPVDYSPIADYLASPTPYGTAIQVLDATGGKELTRFPGHEGAVTDIRFSPRGDRLATAGKDQIIRLWNASGFLQPCELRPDAAKTATSFEYSIRAQGPGRPRDGVGSEAGGLRPASPRKILPLSRLRRAAAIEKDRFGRLVFWWRGVMSGARRRWDRLVVRPDGWTFAELGAVAVTWTRLEESYGNWVERLLGWLPGWHATALQVPGGGWACKRDEARADTLLAWSRSRTTPASAELLATCWPKYEQLRELGGGFWLVVGVNPEAISQNGDAHS